MQAGGGRPRHCKARAMIRTKTFVHAAVGCLGIIAICGSAPAFAVCGDGVIEAGEDCDDGGICVGGDNAGTACTSESHCQGEGVCDAFGIPGGGLRKICRNNADCDGARCVHCQPFGGDGCAANCTVETTRRNALKPGVVNGAGIQPGTSGAVVNADILTIPLPLSGETDFIVGREKDGYIPVVQRPEGIQLSRIPVSTLACACVRGIEYKTCGGAQYEANGVTASTDCSLDAGVCSRKKPCVSVAGPGNVGIGTIGCGGLTSVSYQVVQDSKGKKPAALTFTGGGGPGSMLLTSATSVGTVVGACTGSGSAYGPDGEFCTNDDPIENRGTPSIQTLTTGTARAEIRNANDIDKNDIGPFQSTGAALDCQRVSNDGDISSGTLSGALTLLDQPTTGDVVVTDSFVGSPMTPPPTATATPVPADTPTRTPARSPTPTPTRTPARSPTPTPTQTPTRSPTPTPTRNPCAGDGPATIEIGSVSGATGQQVLVPVYLHAQTARVSGTLNGITTDGTPIGFNSAPDCRSNPALGTSVSCDANPISCGASGCSAITVSVPATINAAPIPDGSTLYWVAVNVPTGTALGTYDLACVGQAYMSIHAAMRYPPDVRAAASPSSPWVLLPPRQRRRRRRARRRSHANPTRTAPPSPPCVGDCNGDGQATVNELVLMVNIGLEQMPVSSCSAGDANQNGSITINEIIAGVTNALNGCPATHVFYEPHVGVLVPGSFTLEQPTPDPATIVVYVQSPLPPFELSPMVENVHYTAVPAQNAFEIRVFALPAQFAMPGTYDFMATYSVASP